MKVTRTITIVDEIDIDDLGRWDAETIEEACKNEEKWTEDDPYATILALFGRTDPKITVTVRPKD